jgi:hypothetical protein
MKHFKIKKSSKVKRKKIFIQDGIRMSLPKPKIPLIVLWAVHDINNFYL